MQNLTTNKSIKAPWILTIERIAKHPYFPVLLFGFILFMLQMIGSTGVIAPSVLSFLSQMLIQYIVALGFLLLLGYTGLASLGTAGFMGLGAYLIGYLYKVTGLPSEVAFIVVIGLSLVIGVIVGFISLRIEGMYLAIVTLGLSEILKSFFTYSPLFGQATGLHITEITFLGITSNLSIVYNSINYIVIAIMVIVMIWIINIINSPVGRAMLSIKNSSSAAQAMGVSLLKYRLTGFTLATLLAVLGGILYMFQNTVAYPGTWGIDLSLNILAAVIIGGTKNIWSLLLGIFVVFGLKNFVFAGIPFFQENTNAYLIVTGALIILVVMFYPNGILSFFKDVKNQFIKLFNWLKKVVKETIYGKE